jgi:hypothetical protein
LQEEDTIEIACKENGKNIAKNKKGRNIEITGATICSE